jgi:hypothetical protein
MSSQRPKVERTSASQRGNGCRRSIERSGRACSYLLLCGSPLSLAMASLTTAREVSMLEASAP